MNPTHPVFVPEMGMVLLTVGDGLAKLRSSLGNRPAMLVPAAEGGDLLAQFPDLASTLLHPAIVKAAGGELALRSVGQCLIGEGCVGETVTTEMGGLPLPLCWHHDNEYRDGQLPFNPSKHASAIALALLTRVAGWCGVPLAQLQAREILSYEFEPLKLKLADKTFYTPDFMVVGKDGLIELHEVKGFWEDDARVKIKVAAKQHWMFTFVGVQRKGANWSLEAF